jgi:flagellar export protein FliJ
VRRFEFRLGAVLRHRRSILEARQRELAQVQADAAAIAAQIRQMRRSRDLHQESIRSASRGRLARTEMIRMRNYVNTLWMRMLLAGRSLAEATGRVEERRRVMVKAHQNVRALEILREKAQAAWQYQADREERVFLDDLRLSPGLLVSPTSAGGES